MGKTNAPITSFNHGLCSRLALARVDLARMRFAAEQQTNWVPRTVGPMTLRPGTQYIGATKNNAVMQPIPFVFSTTDTAMIEATAGALRFRVSDALISRPAVSATVVNGGFDTAAGWTLTTTGGATASIASSSLILQAEPLGSVAKAWQAITIAPADFNVEHALRINIGFGGGGPVRLKVGTSQDTDDLIDATDLGSGEHSLAFAPATSLVYIQFETRLRHSVFVFDCNIEAAGTLEIATDYTADDLDILRWAQSGDVVYVACENKLQRKIERRAARSWSFVEYLPNDGPVKVAATESVLITPDGTSGQVILTADVPFFKASMVGSLLRMTMQSQNQSTSLSAADTFTNAIRISGVHDPDNPSAGGRTFTLILSGAYVGTLTLQRSFDAEDFGYEDISTYTQADNGTYSLVDEYDNSIAWYRIGFKAGEYTSGTATATLAYPGGGYAGIVRIATVLSSTSADSRVLSSSLAAAVGTRDWQEGEWSDKYGYPSAVALHEGRLWWFGKDRIWGSVSDAYESFDVTKEGDAASIQRSIGYGPVENISWALSLHRLLLGTGASEVSIRSSSFDEPLTPTNFGLKDASTQGSSKVAAVKVDGRGLFVTRSKRRLYQLLFSVENGDYTSNDLTALLPDIGTNLVKLGVQRHPDTRIHAVCADGTALILLFEPSEEVICWYKVETDGLIENVFTLPEDIEDRVYYVIKRTINGSDVRYIEKCARLDQCTGLPGARLSDAHVVYSGAATATIAGLDHLEGETVVAWAWDNSDTSGTDFGALGEVTPTYTVSGGSITLPSAKENAVVGLPYTARFKSAKLAYAAAAGTALTQKKRIDHVGVILMNTHGQGIRFGQTFDKMDGLPQMYRGAVITADRVYEDYDEPAHGLPGTWGTDSRLCIEAKAPRPATVLGAVISISTHDKA